MSSSSPFVYAPSVSTDQGLDLDDPFIGILGEKGGRDDLWLGKAVPRYTSYPPATAFEAVPTAQEYRSVLAHLPAAEPLSFYFHVPFCRSLCYYCGCNTCATHQHERVTRYMGYVHREMENVALTSTTARKISRLHFGGGSPNILSEKDMGLLFGLLMRRFDMSACREIAVELDPRLITRAQVKILAMLGVNRVSLGVQDFNPAVMHAIGRRQSYEMIRQSCELLREAGIHEINFDLIYGLPLQSPASLVETAEEVVALLPSRVALFSYAHVPQVKKHQKVLEQYILPGPHACLAMESAVRRVLVSAGYAEIGMDHFALSGDPLEVAAKAGTLRRNFQGYTDDAATTMLGLGASSIGRTPSAYYQNARTTETYEQKISEEGFAVARCCPLSGEDRLRGAIIEQLMCGMSVNLETTCRAHNFSLAVLGDAVEALAPYERSGLITREGYKITLASPHRMAIRVIASLFDKTERTADAPVSRAV